MIVLLVVVLLSTCNTKQATRRTQNELKGEGVSWSLWFAWALVRFPFRCLGDWSQSAGKKSSWLAYVHQGGVDVHTAIRYQARNLLPAGSVCLQNKRHMQKLYCNEVGENKLISHLLDFIR